MLRIVIVALLLTGCQTDAPCPQGFGDPGDTCYVLMIPGPDDALASTEEALSTLRKHKLFGLGRSEKEKED